MMQVSLYTFVTPLGSSMMAPALPAIATHFNITSDLEEALTLSVFLITFAIGPLFLGPLSEIYGRQWASPFLLEFDLILNQVGLFSVDTAHMQPDVPGI